MIDHDKLRNLRANALKLKAVVHAGPSTLWRVAFGWVAPIRLEDAWCDLRRFTSEDPSHTWYDIQMPDKNSVFYSSVLVALVLSSKQNSTVNEETPQRSVVGFGHVVLVVIVDKHHKSVVQQQPRCQICVRTPLVPFVPLPQVTLPRPIKQLRIYIYTCIIWWYTSVQYFWNIIKTNIIRTGWSRMKSVWKIRLTWRSWTSIALSCMRSVEWSFILRQVVSKWSVTKCGEKKETTSTPQPVRFLSCPSGGFQVCLLVF